MGMSLVSCFFLRHSVHPLHSQADRMWHRWTVTAARVCLMWNLTEVIICFAMTSVQCAVCLILLINTSFLLWLVLTLVAVAWCWSECHNIEGMDASTYCGNMWTGRVHAGKLIFSCVDFCFSFFLPLFPFSSYLLKISCDKTKVMYRERFRHLKRSLLVLLTAKSCQFSAVVQAIISLQQI